MGLNEFAGYVAVALAAFASGLVASRWGLREGPSYLGVAVALGGLLISFFLVRDTTPHARLEESRTPRQSGDEPAPFIKGSRARSGREAAPFSVSQAGFVNNLNDGLAWGIFPLLFMSAGLSLEATSLLAAIYPATWGVCQIWTGALSDIWGRKLFIVTGMVMQGLALVSLGIWPGGGPWAAALSVLGVGTALVYPTLLAAVADHVRPVARAAAIGVYRLWRDLGYAAGALLVGVLADAIGMLGAINVVGAITIASGLLVAFRLNERSVPGENVLGTRVQKPFTTVE